MGSLYQDFDQWKGYTQGYYGGYCNQARDAGLTPVPYHIFQGLVDVAYIHCTTKKERMSFLLAETRKYKE
ncbi:hypothetical protein [Bacillus phage SDFMU_Pbc]|uniref:Uncharacterized protein n=1 Tax=Bacillus phage SDFMU_Pbc TaxID=3076135 RepID=A0AA96KRE5_9CAUD|nr:hypothetical protein [Bacillus phage SDFMU_Pbc]